TCVATRPAENVEAYELYLQGRDQMRAEHVDQALKFYMKARQNDQSFALAYTGLADVSLAKYNQTKVRRRLDEALNAASKAQRLNDNLPEAHLALGSVYAASGKTQEAIDEIKRGLSRAPTDEGFRRL